MLLCPCEKLLVEASSRPVRITKPNNIHALGIKLNEESWVDVYNKADVDEKVDVFTNKLTTILDKTVPTRSVRIHPSDKPWITTRIKIKARQNAFTKSNKAKYEHLRNATKFLL